MNKFIKQLVESKIDPKKNKKKQDVEEIVDDKGNIIAGKEATDAKTKGISSDSISDEVAQTGAGQSGNGYGNVIGLRSYVRLWGESDMSKSLGYEDTLGQDEDYEEAKDHFQNELGLDDKDAEERLEKMGYDKNLPDDKVRLVENPRKFIEEYINDLLSKKSNNDEFVPRDSQEQEEDVKEINPIVKKQLTSLKNSLKSHNLSIKDISKFLEGNE